jgi:hypothetical protein
MNGILAGGNKSLTKNHFQFLFPTIRQILLLANPENSDISSIGVYGLILRRSMENHFLFKQHNAFSS